MRKGTMRKSDSSFFMICPFLKLIALVVMIYVMMTLNTMESISAYGFVEKNTIKSNKYTIIIKNMLVNSLNIRLTCM